MAESSCDTSSVTPPEITIILLSGAVVWGPRRVDLHLTAGKLVDDISRPTGCPGVELVHDVEVLGADVDISRLPDRTRLTANFLPPQPFDHSFVTELLALEGVMDGSLDVEGAPLPGSLLDPSKFEIPNAEVLKAIVPSGGELSRVKLQIRLGKEVDTTESLDSVKFVMEFEDCDDGDDSKLNVPLSITSAGWQVLQNGPSGKVVEVEVEAAADSDEGEDLCYCCPLVHSPVDDLVARHAAKRVFEGVSCSFGEVADTFMQRLNALIDELKSSEPADYHPGSNNVVRDLVHPSLHPFIKGISPMVLDLPEDEAKAVTSALTHELSPKRDMWNRPYEISKFQWLPAEVSVTAAGTCEFQSYINNLPKEKYSELYTALGELLTKCLPHLEAAWSHASAIDFFDGDTSVYDIYYSDAASDGEVGEKCLRDQNLQVIVKIVDYELAPGQSHEGVWHVEGMSHENIVATAELVLQKDPSLQGGELEFQRAWTKVEAGRFGGLPQCRAAAVDRCIEKGLCPLGRLPLEQGQLTAWPNSHVHKLAPLRNNSDQPAQRRIVVFWLVNPDRQIISSKHVSNQQGVISAEDAAKYRLELMEERKRHKQDWNIREVSLCEH